MKSPSHVVILETSDTYIPECAAWYVAGVLVILLRFVTRVRTVGLNGFRGDDYLSLLYLALYTACLVIVVFTYYSGSAMEVNEATIDLLTEEDIEILTMGSRIEYLSFFIYTGCIWSLKFSVLFFYNSLTLGIIRRKTIIFLAWLCGVSYIVLCLTALLSCRPLSANWQIKPRPGPECIYRPQNFWTLVFLNVTTDAAILSIPVPILWHLRVRPLRKLGIALLLSSGLFVIGTAIVRAWITISGRMSVIVINLWGFRELGVGLIAVTAPVVYPFFRPSFWARGPYLPADRRRQLQLLRRQQPRHPGNARDEEYGRDGDDGPLRRSGPPGHGKPGIHDTAIELQSIDEQMTAFLFADDDEDDDGDEEEAGRARPRSPPWRTISSSTTIVASEPGCSRQASLGQGGEGRADAHARGARPGTSGSSTATAAIEETDWALQYMPK